MNYLINIFGDIPLNGKDLYSHWLINSFRSKFRFIFYYELTAYSGDIFKIIFNLHPAYLHLNKLNGLFNNFSINSLPTFKLNSLRIDR